MPALNLVAKDGPFSKRTKVSVLSVKSPLYSVVEQSSYNFSGLRCVYYTTLSVVAVSGEGMEIKPVSICVKCVVREL